MVASIESRMDSILKIDGWAEGRLMEDIFLSLDDSEREKIKDVMRAQDGDERNRSWSEG